MGTENVQTEVRPLLARFILKLSLSNRIMHMWCLTYACGSQTWWVTVFLLFVGQETNYYWASYTHCLLPVYVNKLYCLKHVALNILMYFVVNCYHIFNKIRCSLISFVTWFVFNEVKGRKLLMAWKCGKFRVWDLTVYTQSLTGNTDRSKGKEALHAWFLCWQDPEHPLLKARAWMFVTILVLLDKVGYYEFRELCQNMYSLDWSIGVQLDRTYCLDKRYKIT